MSIDRKLSVEIVEDITNLAIEYHKKFPNIVVGLELSGNPTVGKFSDIIPYLNKARETGLKVISR